MINLFPISLESNYKRVGICFITLCLLFFSILAHAEPGPGKPTVSSTTSGIIQENLNPKLLGVSLPVPDSRKTTATATGDENVGNLLPACIDVNSTICRDVNGNCPPGASTCNDCIDTCTTKRILNTVATAVVGITEAACPADYIVKAVYESDFKYTYYPAGSIIGELPNLATIHALTGLGVPLSTAPGEYIHSGSLGAGSDNCWSDIVGFIGPDMQRRYYDTFNCDYNSGRPAVVKINDAVCGPNPFGDYEDKYCGYFFADSSYKWTLKGSYVTSYSPLPRDVYFIVPVQTSNAGTSKWQYPTVPTGLICGRVKQVWK